MEHLWTDGPCPPEYLEYLFCRHIWHCTPAEFRQQDPVALLQHLTCMQVEDELRAVRRRS